MSFELVLGLIGLIGLFGILAVALGPAARASRRAIITAIVLVPLLPLNGADAAAIAIGFGAMIISLLTALVRQHAGVRYQGVIWWAVALLLIIRLGTIFTEGSIGLLSGALTVLLCLLIFVASQLTAEDKIALATAFAVVMAIHIGYALLEVTLRIPGVWPMSDGTNIITSRPHEILAWLPGRPMTSFSHPIPFAYYLLTGMTFAAYAALKGARWLWLGVALGVFGIVLSGTRSALLAIGVMAVIAFISTFRVRRIIVAIVLIALVLVVLRGQAFGNALRFIGLGEDFSGSASYRHRSMVAGSFPSLFGQPAEQVLFGWGTDIHWIFDNGIVPRYSSDFYFFDNQFVASMVQFGLAGLIPLVIALVLVAVRGRALERMLVAIIVTMAFSFDLLTHLVGLFSFALAVGIASRRGSDEAVMSEVEPEVEGSPQFKRASVQLRSRQRSTLQDQPRPRGRIPRSPRA